MQDYIFYDYVYDEIEIATLKQLCEDSVNWLRVGEIITSENQQRGCNRYYVSLQDYLDPNKIIEKYINFLPEHTAISLHEGLSKCNLYISDIKIAKYTENDCYNWHTDYWTKREGHELFSRQLSSITYINDDYEGGETEFSFGTTIKPKKGKTVIFPSTWLFPHQGKPVIKGTKYIYVSHIWA